MSFPPTDESEREPVLRKEPGEPVSSGYTDTIAFEREMQERRGPALPPRHPFKLTRFLLDYGGVVMKIIVE